MVPQASRWRRTFTKIRGLPILPASFDRDLEED